MVACQSVMGAGKRARTCAETTRESTRARTVHVAPESADVQMLLLYPAAASFVPSAELVMACQSLVAPADCARTTAQRVRWVSGRL